MTMRRSPGHERPTPAGIVRPRRYRFALVVAVAAVALTASHVDAHDTWLLPSSLRVPVGQRVTLHLTSGVLFAADDFAINAGRILRADVRLAGATRPLGNRSQSDNATLYRWTPATAGVAALAVELAPKVLTLEPELIGVYLDEIGATREVRAAWDAMPAPKKWREEYVKHAATFVRVGNSPDAGWTVPLGLGFELQPLADPTALAPGQALDVRVSRGGNAVAAQPVTLRREGDATITVVTTDATGRATLRLAREGRYLIAATNLRRASRKNLEWESDFATLTLAVAPAR